MIYSDLDTWTDILAATLQAHGVGPGKSCGIYLDKGVNFVVSYIAALKAGKLYLYSAIPYWQTLPIFSDTILVDFTFV